MSDSLVNTDAKTIAYKNFNGDIHAQLSLKAEQNTTKKYVPGQDYLPVTGKVLDADDLLHGVDAALDGWLTTGRFGPKFEQKLAKWFGCKSSLVVNSGSSANLVAFFALTSPKLGDRAIKPGDEIITVAAGFPTTVNPMIQFGCIPVFIDIDIPGYNIKRN